MIGRFLGRLFGGSGEPGESAGGRVLASESYQGFDIEAAPVNEGGGWRVSGVISRTLEDGDVKTHQFVRADTCPDAESAAAMTVRKAKQLIDERGDAVFD
jgi:hypothetical protein